MNQDDIIRMAREAHLDVYGLGKDRKKFVSVVERFADLVAAAERERLKWDGIHSCYPECDRPACVHTRKAVEAEREECAKTADDIYNGIAYEYSANVAEAIRARGQS